MTEIRRNSPHYLISRYVQGDLTQEESRELLALLRSNKNVVAALKANLLVDAWLKEAKRGTTAGDRKTSAELFAKALTTMELPETPAKPAVAVPAPAVTAPAASKATAPAAETASSVELDWDELVRLQNAEKPIAQMSPEEVAAYRARMAVPVSNVPQSNAKQQNEDYDPFAVLRKLEEREERRRIPVKRKPHKWTLSDFFLIGSVAVAILIGVAVYQESQWELHRRELTPPAMVEPTEEFLPVARVTELVDPDWAPESTKYKRGQSLETGELALEKGMAKIEFKNGAVVVLQGPGQFAIKGALDTFCTQGRLSATIPQSATGFTVNTPLGTVRDRGTEFFVSVGQNELAVETNKGLVEITTSDTDPVPITTGETIQVSRKGTGEKYRTKTPRFTTLDAFTAQLTAYVAKLRKEKEQSDLVLDADPNLLVRFDADNRQGNRIPNSSLAGRAQCPELDVTGVHIAEGRWHNREALGFSSQSSECVFHLDGSFRRLVLTANIRFDHLGTQENTLCASRNFLKVPGAFLWQICRTGELLLFVTDRKDHAELYSSKAVMTVRDCGVWYKISVIIDADEGTVSHFVNARLISKVPWKEPLDLVPGECLIGRAPREVLKGNGPQFDGAIDEFRVATGK
ncbi:MAG: FecR domain-containing protein [Planctomycetia bacterium]|nr:FecR domain-containing protein [Planctomycetia bacterium]